MPWIITTIYFTIRYENTINNTIGSNKVQVQTGCFLFFFLSLTVLIFAFSLNLFRKFTTGGVSKSATYLEFFIQEMCLIFYFKKYYLTIAFIVLFTKIFL